jgi:transcription elongation factor Elf1
MDDFLCPCPKCFATKSWKRSIKKHGKPGAYFVVCKLCGYETQATNSGIFSTNPAKNRFCSVANHMVTARLADDEYYAYQSSGKTVREIISLGLASL